MASHLRERLNATLGGGWREIEIPAPMQGKRIFLRVRGAHLRAEVYLNEKLVGYSIIEELPFEAELTHAAKPGSWRTRCGGWCDSGR